MSHQEEVMEKVSSYKDLLIWQRGMLIAEQAHKLSAGFPSSEAYGLTSQLRRAGTSVPSDIGEESRMINSFIKKLEEKQFITTNG